MSYIYSILFLVSISLLNEINGQSQENSSISSQIHRNGQITVEKRPKLSGFRVEPVDMHDGGGFYGYTPKGLSLVDPDAEMLVVIMGFWLDEVELIGFTITDNCTDAIFKVEKSDYMVKTEKRMIFRYEFDVPNAIFKLCMQSTPILTLEGKYVVQPFSLIDEPDFHVSTVLPPRTYHFPLPFQIGLLVVLLVLSGLFSGLNLGLMALSPQELELISKSGTENEKKYAKAIIPVRKHGNFLLCSLLLGNVIVNSAISILFDDLTSGLVALIVASLGIVVFGEIVPQSICVKKGLEVGAHTVWITKFFMVVTSPASYPISKILDWLLGQEVVSYDRRRLIELIKLSSLENTELVEELKIAVGAMEIADKTVGDVMTKINDVFMLPETTILNTKTINEILRMGYTRIPIYSDDRNNVVSLLFVKDLALIDPDDDFTVKTVCEYYKHKLRFVMADMSLRSLLEEFKKGDYHLAMVQSRLKEDNMELVGLITLEDIIEEILQAEIMDETDVIVDNVTRTKIPKRKESRYLPALFENDSSALLLSTQMQNVTIAWLRTNHSAFHTDLIAQNVLEKLVRQHVRQIEVSTEALDPSDVSYNPATKLYTKKHLTNKFILILEGRVNVTIGESQMTFEAGPWYCFGTEILDSVLKLIRKHKENQENEKFQDIAFIDTSRSWRDQSPLKKTRDGSVTSREVSLTRRDLSGSRRDGSTSRPGEFSTRQSLESEARRISFVPDYTAVITDDCTFLEISASTYVTAYKTSLISFDKP